MRACVGVCVHCQQLPSGSDASEVAAAVAFRAASAKLSAAGFEFSIERFEFCAISAPIEAAYLRCARQDSSGAEVCCLTGQVACSTFGIYGKCRCTLRRMTSVGLHDMWYTADVHDAVRHVPYCATHTACTASVRCILQRELRNLRADLGQSFWFGEPRTGRLDSCTYE
jgi:hypothetical protein